MFNGFVLSTARADGDATGVQVPRHVGLLYRKDLLDAAAQLPLCGRRVEGPLRWGLAGHGAQHRPGCSRAAERRGTAQSTEERPIQIPTAATQSRP